VKKSKSKDIILIDSRY